MILTLFLQVAFAVTITYTPPKCKINNCNCQCLILKKIAESLEGYSMKLTYLTNDQPPDEKQKKMLDLFDEGNKVIQGDINLVLDAEYSNFAWTPGLNPCIGIVIDGTTLGIASYDSVKKSQHFATLDHNDGGNTDLLTCYEILLESQNGNIENKSNKEQIILNIDNSVGYDLVLMSEDDVKQKIEAGKLHVKLEDGKISYKASDMDKIWTIAPEDLPNDAKMPTYNAIENIERIKNSILCVTSKRGHTYSVIKYEVSNYKGEITSEILFPNQISRKHVEQDLAELSRSNTPNSKNFKDVNKEIITRILIKHNLIDKAYQTIVKKVISLTMLNLCLEMRYKENTCSEITINNIFVVRNTSNIHDNNNILATALNIYLQKNMLPKIVSDMNSKKTKFLLKIHDKYDFEMREQDENATIRTGNPFDRSNPTPLNIDVDSTDVAILLKDGVLHVLSYHGRDSIFTSTSQLPPVESIDIQLFTNPTNTVPQNVSPSENCSYTEKTSEYPANLDNILQNTQGKFTPTYTNSPLSTDKSSKTKTRGETSVNTNDNLDLYKMHTKKKNEQTTTKNKVKKTTKVKKKRPLSSDESDTSDNNSESSTTPNKKMILTEKPLSVEQQNKNKKFKKSNNDNNT